MKPAPLFIIGLGPGDPSLLTPLALEALHKAQCIAGYASYLTLLPEPILAQKEIISTGMRQETSRCEQAIDAALAGKTTAMVSSGDPGIYAMAPLILEIMEKRNIINQLPLHIVPGVPALCALSARLGAPLGHDFACISLSDLLTPQARIRSRLQAALQADFVCVLYNPRSRQRTELLDDALSMARSYRHSSCPVALGKNIFRKNENLEIFTLADFDPGRADMLSLIIIGNEETRKLGHYLLTPRGYASKFQ